MSHTRRITSNPIVMVAFCTSLLIACTSPTFGQCELQKINSPIPDQNIHFGYDNVGISGSGNYVAVGAPSYLNIDQNESGALYVYKRNGDQWDLDFMRTGLDDPWNKTRERFGGAVDMAGDYMIVGGVGHSTQPQISALYGHTVIYYFNGNAWEIQNNTYVECGLETCTYGTAVAISNELAVVGDTGRGADYSDTPGSAYIYRRSGTNWILEQHIISSTVRELNLFGRAVDTDGTRVVIHEPGVVHVYHKDIFGWTLEESIYPPNPLEAGVFGGSFSIEGNQLMIGDFLNDGSCPSPNCFAGVVFVYEHDGTSWVLSQTLTPTDAHSNDFFGSYISLKNNTATISAIGYDREEQNAGVVYIFERINSTWVEKKKFFPAVASQSDNFGGDISHNGSMAVMTSSTEIGINYEIHTYDLNIDYCVCESNGLADCNQNAIADICEIEERPLQDCNHNSIIDECELENTPSLDCNWNGVIDTCDIIRGTNQDCNNNNRPDDCDILADPSLDCNQNGFMDDCDVSLGRSDDCNTNNIPDDCEGLVTLGSDCNGNGILDSCDIADNFSFDVDFNCVPDECDPAIAPLAEPDPYSKSRYLSFVPTNAGCNTAVRVALSDLPDFPSFVAQYRWVGPPQKFLDTVGSTTMFTGASLQCDPYFMDWSTAGLVHAYGAAVVPGSQYDIQLVDESCADLSDPGCFTNPLTVRTGKWGDVIAPFFEPGGSQQPSIADVLAIVDKWLGSIEPSKPRTQLQPNIVNPSMNVGIADILKCVDAWLGLSYPYSGPEGCP